MSFPLPAAASAAAFLLALVGVPLAARAQNPCASYVTTPSLGSWGEYQATKDGQPSVTMRFAVVGQERRGGRILQRFETSLRGISAAGQMEEMIMQVLVPGYPYEPESIEEVVVKGQGKPAMRMSPATMAQLKAQMKASGQLSMADQCKGMAAVGDESLKVPPGTFRVRHFRDARTHNEIWMSRALPFGMVKTKDDKGVALVLVGHGRGARSAIVEAPVPMPVPVPPPR